MKILIHTEANKDTSPRYPIVYSNNNTILILTEEDIEKEINNKEINNLRGLYISTLLIPEKYTDRGIINETFEKNKIWSVIGGGITAKSKIIPY